MKNKIFAFILTAALLSQAGILTACTQNNGSSDKKPQQNIEGETFNMPEIRYSTYDNIDFSDYSLSGELVDSNIPDQWTYYGVGDPYVFRFNGWYYMYCSTKNNQDGVRAWKSKDLINWQKCNPDGAIINGIELPSGYVCMDETINGAYAPEVYYFNGTFYMYSSPKGKGHYVYASDDPEGPFVRVTDNFGMNIDGSVFIDDDEKMYFISAHGAGVAIRTMENMTDIDVTSSNYKSAVLANTDIGGWTEGPMLIKRNGIYYMTYTGTDVLSEGYRVSYSTEFDGNTITDRNSFTKGVDLPVLLTVDEEENFKGLGHSSTVLGPDLDSYYIVYHTLKSPAGPYRSMAVDRLIFNGTQMSVKSNAKGSIAARMPEYTVDNGSWLNALNGKLLSAKATGNTFSAEYNFYDDDVKLICSYNGDGDYAYVRVSYAQHKIELVKHGATDTVVATGALKNDFDPDVLHTVRIAYRDGKVDVYFDNMCKISEASISLTGGKIGYENAAVGSIGCTTFTSAARGSSDATELKTAGVSVGASNYLPEGALSGITSHNLSSASGLFKTEIADTYPTDAGYNGAYSLRLNKAGDFAKYLVYFKNAGHYGLKLTYEAKYGGKNIGVRYGSGEIKTVTLPRIQPGENGCVVTAFIDEADFAAGPAIVSMYGAGDDVAFISFNLEEKSYGAFTFENSLKEVISEGALYTTMYRQVEGGHATRAGSSMLCYIGDATLSDFEVEVDIKFLSENSYKAGLLIRGKNFATASSDGISAIQGYFVSLDTRLITLSKFNYGYSLTNIEAEAHGVTRSKLLGHQFRLKVTAKGNTLTVALDGEKIIEYTDAHAFLTGHIGLYSDGAEVVYKNIKIKGI